MQIYVILDKLKRENVELNCKIDDLIVCLFIC